MTFLIMGLGHMDPFSFLINTNVKHWRIYVQLVFLPVFNSKGHFIPQMQLLLDI